MLTTPYQSHILNSKNTTEFIHNSHNNQQHHHQQLIHHFHTIGLGLYNLSNTCFLNSILQVLFYTPFLSTSMSHLQHSNTCGVAKWCAYCALQKTYIYSRIRNSQAEPLQKINKKYICASSIIRHLINIMPKYQLGNQQDAHEFLRYLMQQIQKCELPNRNELIPQQNSQQNIVKLTRQQQIQQQHKTRIYKIFGGTLQSRLQCLGCHHISKISQSFYDLSLECQISDSVDEGLKSFFKQDILQGFSCEKCLNKNENVKKYFKISGKLPKILTVHLKRFQGGIGKILKKVKFQDQIELGDYYEYQDDNKINENQKKRKNIKKQKINGRYKLFGVTVHHGFSANFGHYYSYIKVNQNTSNSNNIKQNWYLMDDQKVIPVNTQQVYDASAYILYYSLQDRQQQVAHNTSKSNFLQQLQLKKADSLQNIKQLSSKCQYFKKNNNNIFKTKLIYKPLNSYRSKVRRLCRYASQVKKNRKYLGKNQIQNRQKNYFL